MNKITSYKDTRIFIDVFSKQNSNFITCMEINGPSLEEVEDIFTGFPLVRLG